MVLVVVTRTEDVTMTWDKGTLLVTGATLNLAIQMNASQMERMRRGLEGVGTATATVNDFEDGTV